MKWIKRNLKCWFQRNLASRILTTLVSIIAWITLLCFSSSLVPTTSPDYRSLKISVLQNARSGSNSFLIRTPRRMIRVVPPTIFRFDSRVIAMAQDGDDNNFESSFAREVARRREQGSSSKSPSTETKSDDPAKLIQNSINNRPSPSTKPNQSSSASSPPSSRSLSDRNRNEDAAKSRSSRSSTSIPRPPPTFQKQSAAPPPPFGSSSSSSNQNAKSSKNTFGSRSKSEEKRFDFFDAFNFDFTDPDYGKPKAQRTTTSSSEGEGSIGERIFELGKLGLGFAASFWPISAVILVLFGGIYFGFGGNFVHGGTSSSRAPSVTAEEVLRDL